MMATFNGHTDIVRILLEKGADVHDQSLLFDAFCDFLNLRFEFF